MPKMIGVDTFRAEPISQPNRIVHIRECSDLNGVVHARKLMLDGRLQFVP